MSNVGFATLQIIPSARGFQAALSRETAPAMAAVGADGGKKAGKGFSGAFMAPVKGIAGPLAAVFAATSAVGFLKGAITEASDLAETANKLQVVFGKATGQVEAFASRGARALGLSDLAAKNAASTFGIYGKAAGLAGTANAKFSTDLVGLSADLASFYNSTPEEAIEAIGSALRGEAEPMRRFGVLLDDASMRAAALKMGLIKTTKEALTPQQKILAAHSLIMKQTAVAQGDFARTSGGLANQQRILSAQWDNLKGKLGSALLPAVTKTVTAVNNLFTGTGRLGSALKGVVALVKGDGGGLAKAFNLPPEAVQRLLALRTAALSAARAFAGNVGTALRQVGSFIVGKVVPAVGQLSVFIASRAIPVVRQAAAAFASDALPTLKRFATFIIRDVAPAVLRIAKDIGSKLSPIVDALAAALRTYVIPTAQLLWRKFEQWRPTLQKIATHFIVVSGKILGFVATILGKALPVVIRFSAMMGGNTVRAIIAVIGAVVRVGKAIYGFGASIGASAVRVAAFVGGLRARFGEAVSFVAGIPGRIVGALGGLGSRLWSAGVDLIRGFIGGIQSMAGNIIGAIRSTITDKLPDYVKKALNINSPSRVFMGLGASVGEGFTLGIERSAGAAQAAMAKVVAPPDAPTLRAGTTTGRAGAAAGAGIPVRVPLYLDSRLIAEAVFAVGGTDYANGRREF